MKKFLTFLWVITCFAFISSQMQAQEISKKELTVAVSIVPQIEFVQQIMGDKGKIICIVPAGASPANYAPSPKERIALNSADIYFSIGVASEEKNILGILPNSLKTVALQEKVTQTYPDLMIGKSRDPHIWLSPKRVLVMLDEIAQELGRLDPENKAEYFANTLKYKEKIIKTDKEIREIFARTSQRNFIAFHPAFGYFADEYGLTMHALEKHGKEAGARHLQKIINLAKKENIRTIFYQKEISGRQVMTFAREIDGNAVMLDPLAPDYTKNLLHMAKSIQENQ